MGDTGRAYEAAQAARSTAHTAGNTLTLTSAGDTTLKGAVGTADRIIANIGSGSNNSSNLHIESLQDTSTYQSQDHNIGGSLSAGAGNIQSDYRNVKEQSGLKAGDSGFQINVTGNTSLTGGVITSSQSAIDQNKNHFDSKGGLTQQDITNSETYNGQAWGISASTNASQITGVGAGLGNASGQQSSLTSSGISGIAGNKDARTGDKVTGIQKIFDASVVNKDITA